MLLWCLKGVRICGKAFTSDSMRLAETVTGTMTYAFRHIKKSAEAAGVSVWDYLKRGAGKCLPGVDGTII